MTDINLLINEYSDDIFYIAYSLASKAIGENDPDIAGQFESEVYPTNSGFANAGGKEVVMAIMGYVDDDFFKSRIVEMNKSRDDLEAGVTERYENAEMMKQDDLPMLAHELSVGWHNALKGAFPEVPSEAIDNTLAATNDAFTAYLKHHYVYSLEHNGADGPAPRM